MMSVELRKAADVIETARGDRSLVENLRQRSRTLRDAVWEHGVMNHPKYGSVFAYEVDGYGSRVFMDDANIPSLLSLPLLGFVDQNDDVYQNTRRMILDQGGNPYFLTGSDFHAIGGPHSKLFPPPCLFIISSHGTNSFPSSWPSQRLANVPSCASPDIRRRLRDPRMHQCSP
jgi:hypothetical protein